MASALKHCTDDTPHFYAERHREARKFRIDVGSTDNRKRTVGIANESSCGCLLSVFRNNFPEGVRSLGILIYTRAEGEVFMSEHLKADLALKQKLEAIVPACKPARDALAAALKYWDGDYNRLVTTPDRELDPHNLMRTLRDCAQLLENVGPMIEDQMKKFGS